MTNDQSTVSELEVSLSRRWSSRFILAFVRWTKDQHPAELPLADDVHQLDLDELDSALADLKALRLHADAVLQGPRQSLSGPFEIDDEWESVTKVISMALEKDAELQDLESELETLLRQQRAFATTQARIQAAAAEQNVDQLMEVFLAQQPVSSVDQELQVENARMRAAYLSDTPLLTAKQINEVSGLSPANPSEPASRWKRDQRIFAVRRGGSDLYPAFQFVDGEPRPVIREILRALPADLSPWQIAFWFATGSGLLDGNAPEDSLSDSRVGEAAQFANQGPVG